MNELVRRQRCKICLCEQDFQEFPLPPTKTCKKCLIAMDLERDRDNRKERARALLQKIVKKGKGANRIEAPHISEACAAAFKEIGGVDEWAKYLAESFHQVMEKAPTSPMAASYHKMFTTMSKWSSEQRSTAPDVTELSDEELANRSFEVIEDYIRSNVDEDGRELLEEMISSGAPLNEIAEHVEHRGTETPTTP